MPHKFHEHGNWSRLLSPERERIIPPSALLAALALQPGHRVLDLGAGVGFATLPIAQTVGPTGVVYAADLLPEPLELLRQRAHEAGQDNVKTLLNTERDIPLPAGSCDRILLLNVLHELADPVALLRECRRVGTNEAVFLVIDWDVVETPMGPPLADRLSAVSALSLLAQAGWQGEQAQWPHPSHYAIRAVAG